MPKPRQGRRYRRDRLIVIASSGGICAICGKPFELGQQIHVDHRTPVAFGGSDHPSNLRATHPKCNMQRGVKPAAGDRSPSRAW